MDENGYRSDLARELGADARERLVRYVQVWTTSDPDSPTAPSTERQLDLSRALLEELKTLGLDAELSDAGVRVDAFVGLPDGSEWVRDTVEGGADDSVSLGRGLAERLLAAGAGEILQRADVTP